MRKKERERERERESWPRIVSRASRRLEASARAAAGKEQVSFVKGAPRRGMAWHGTAWRSVAWASEQSSGEERRGEERVAVYPRPIIPPVFFFSVPRPRPTYPGIVEDLQPSLRPVLSGVAAGYRRGCCHGG